MVEPPVQEPAYPSPEEEVNLIHEALERARVYVEMYEQQSHCTAKAQRELKSALEQNADLMQRVEELEDEVRALETDGRRAAQRPGGGEDRPACAGGPASDEPRELEQGPGPASGIAPIASPGSHHTRQWQQEEQQHRDSAVAALERATQDRDEALEERDEALQRLDELADKYDSTIAALHRELAQLHDHCNQLYEATDELQRGLRAEQDTNEGLVAQIEEMGTLLSSCGGAAEPGTPRRVKFGLGADLAAELAAAGSFLSQRARKSRCESSAHESRIQLLRREFEETFQAQRQGVEEQLLGLWSALSESGGPSRRELRGLWRAFREGNAEVAGDPGLAHLVPPAERRAAAAAATAPLRLEDFLAASPEELPQPHVPRQGFHIALVSSRRVRGVTWYLFRVSDGGEEWHHLKRYSDFARLDRLLRAVAPRARPHATLPGLPEAGKVGLRHRLGCRDFDGRRRQDLQTYVKVLAEQVGSLPEDPALHAFFARDRGL